MRIVGRILLNAAKRMMRHDGVVYAGHLALTAMLSFFPFLIFLIALAGFAGEAEITQAFVYDLFNYVPDQVGETLLPAVNEILTSKRGGLLTFGLAAALWIASGGVEAVRVVLDRAYAIEERRPFWHRRLESLAVVITGGTLILVLSLSIILGPAIWSVVTAALSLPENVSAVAGTAQDLIAIGVLSAILTVVHVWLPNHKLRLRDVAPGSILTALLWIGLANVFSIYLANLASYDVTYGSLGGIVLTLVYFQLSALIFVYGAELNAAIGVYREAQQRHEARSA